MSIKDEKTTIILFYVDLISVYLQYYLMSSHVHYPWLDTTIPLTLHYTDLLWPWYKRILHRRWIKTVLIYSTQLCSNLPCSALDFPALFWFALLYFTLFCSAIFFLKLVLDNHLKGLVKLAVVSRSEVEP